MKKDLDAVTQAVCGDQVRSPVLQVCQKLRNEAMSEKIPYPYHLCVGGVRCERDIMGAKLISAQCGEGEEEKEEEEGGGSGGEEGGGGSRAWEDEEQEHNQAHFTHPRPSHHHLLSPLNTNFVHEEVKDDNREMMTCHDFLLRTLMQTTLQLTLTAPSPGSVLTSTPQTTPCLKPC